MGPFLLLGSSDTPGVGASVRSSPSASPPEDGILEREIWDSVDPMKPLGLPVGKPFGRDDYAGYVVGFDHRRAGGSDLVRYEDGDLRHFPAQELATWYCQTSRRFHFPS